jgi:hypothetical protein
MSQSHLTTFGLPGVGVVPYGFHACHFYPSREDLIDGLLPYFMAGLANNERCIWIASHPLPAAEIAMEVAQRPKLERGLTSGQLEIRDAADWYGESAAVAAEQIVERCIDEEARAIADGHEGLRISFNTSLAAREDWGRLMEFETRLHHQLRDRRIVACCSYSGVECRPVDMLEVVRCHGATLERRDAHWQVFVQNAAHGQRSKF